MQTIWGFDLGVTSVGWAVIRWDEAAAQGEIVRMGVRVFPETREAKKPGEVGDPLNAARRSKRLARRMLRRKRWRRVHLRHTLVSAGLLPKDAEPGKHRNACPPPAGFDPYAVRVRGLTEALPPHDLGWALFHLLKRRGFQGSRKYGSAEEEGAELATAKPKPRKGGRRDGEETPALSEEQKKREKEEKEARAKREKLRAEIAAIAAREGKDRATLAAALLARRDPVCRAAAERPDEFHDPTRLRDAQQDRGMVQDEFGKLWAAQAVHHPHILTDALRAKLHHIGFSQRPTFFRARTIGKCFYAPQEDRALKGDWLTQRFETLAFVNNLRLARGKNPPLDAGQRDDALHYLEQQWTPAKDDKTKRARWDALRTAVGLPKEDRFTQERGEKDTLRGNATEYTLRAALGEAWRNMPEGSRQAIRDAIGSAVREAEYRPVRNGAILEIRDKECWRRQREALARRAESAWGLDADNAKALSEITLPDGYARHARSTMLRLMPHLEAGRPYSEAVELEFGSRRESGPHLRKLPGPNQSEVNKLPRNTEDEKFVHAQMSALLAAIRNPTVLRTLGELQKVVNALLRKYGRPDLIRLEFFRGLKQSREERAATDKRQAEREGARKNAADEIRKRGKPVTGDSIQRWLLWEEQGKRSPYSERHISCTQALDPGATEIDHIFPVSRSFDPGPGNQVLCFVDENRAKLNRTPYEWLASVDPERWKQLSEPNGLWRQMTKNAKWPGWDQEHQRPVGKYARCLKETLEDPNDPQFMNRHATDTAFIAKAARDYLGLLWGGGQEALNKVKPVQGRATSLLRRAWGLSLKRLLYGEIEAGDAPKARDDLRHHAVDALAIALCTDARIKALSEWWQQRELFPHRPKPEFRLPWPGLHAQAKERIEAIVVSHRVQARLSGRMHEEQPLGDTGLKDGDQRLFARRKPVIALSAAEIAGTKDSEIADKAVRDAILKHLAASGIVLVPTGRARRGEVQYTLSETNKQKIAKALAGEIRLPMTDQTKGHSGEPGPLVRRVRLHIKRNGVLLQLGRSKNAHAELGPGTTYRLALYRDGETVRHRQVTKREALARVRHTPALPAVPPEHPDGGRLIAAVGPGDVLMRKVPTGRELLLVRKTNAEGRIFHKPLTLAGQPDSEPSLGPADIADDDNGWRKVSVDPIGDIHTAK
jgi:CRISPR-associated endonuclease Csn1